MTDSEKDFGPHNQLNISQPIGNRQVSQHKRSNYEMAQSNDLRAYKQYQ